jgi:hypothetical protein
VSWLRYQAAYARQGAPPEPPPEEAFPVGGFLPEDREDRDRRRKRIRETIEGVVRPKAVAAAVRDAVAPKPVEDAPEAMREAFKPSPEVLRLRELADSAGAEVRRRRAIEDDDEDVFLLLGA